VGGSFCSDKLEPKDIDAVLFYRYPRPMPQPEMRDAFLLQHAPVMSNMGSKLNFGVDSASIALSVETMRLVHFAAHWALLFSGRPEGKHQPFYSVQGSSFRQSDPFPAI
jgi:hypothetical protein